MKEQRGSWLSLVMLCAVTALSAALGFGVLFAGASVVFAVAESPSASETGSEATPPDSLSANQVSGNPVFDNQPAQAVASPLPQPSSAKETAESGTASGTTFAGMITDSRCGARHSRDSGKTSAECARACVRNGSRYVLVDGEEVHVLDGDPTPLDKLAGVRVEVVGMLEGDAIRVKSIAAR